MADQVAIRPMRWWDIPAALELEAELFGAEAWTAAMLWSELARHETREFVVAEGERILGYAGLAVMGDEGWIQTIGVTASAQRRGIGRALMDHLLERAARRSCRSVWLEVAVDNAPAQAMYRGYGFEAVGVRKGYYQPSNTDALVMRKELG